MKAGADFGGVNIVVTPVREYHVRGVVLDAVTGRAAQYASLNTVEEGLRSSRIGEAPNANPETGIFGMVGPPGTYTLTADSANGTGAITIRRGDADLDNVTIYTTPRFDIRGRVALAGGSPPPAVVAALGGLRISLVRKPAQSGRAPSSSYSTPIADGSFVLEGALGDFRVNVAPILNVTPASGARVPAALQNAYVKSIRLGDVDVLNGGLHLERPPQNLLDIVLATDAGRIEGVAVNDIQQETGEISVVLVPDIRSRTELYQAALTDPSGGFRFDVVPPGGYKIFAWADVENGAWYDPEFMREYEDRGIPVRVREGVAEQLRVPATR